MPKGTSNRTFADAIRDATADEMRSDPSTILTGLGVTDPGRVFGTTAGLVEEFGPDRVFETPTSENAIMGVGVGAALGGLRPILTHQRADFVYLALDQLVNSAAKWRFMFGGQFTVPIVVRLIVGRGWGQGPTHSQNLVQWLSQVPGIEVYYPSSSEDAYLLMRQAVRSDNPSVVIEDRWLHGIGPSLESLQNIEQSRPSPVLTICSYGFGVHTAQVAQKKMSAMNVTTKIIAIDRFNEDYLAEILQSVAKTRLLLLVDFGTPGGSLMLEILGRLTARVARRFDFTAEVLSIPDYPQPTGFEATRHFYPGVEDIVAKSLHLLGLNSFPVETEVVGPHDQPASLLSGPF